MCDYFSPFYTRHIPVTPTGFELADIDENTLDKLCDLFAGSDIMLGGEGEPTMSLALDKILKKFVQKFSGQSISMLTNGSRLDKLSGEALKSINLLAISLDSCDARIYKKLRIGGNFNKVVDNIRSVREAFPELSITFNCVVSKMNVDSCLDFYNFCRQFRPEAINFQKIGGSISEPLLLDDEDICSFGYQKQHMKDIHLFLHYFNDYDLQLIKCKPVQRVANADLSSSLLNKMAEFARTAIPPETGLRITSINPHLECLKQKAYSFNGDKDVLGKDIQTKLKKYYEEAREKKSKENLLEPYCYAPWRMANVHVGGNIRTCCSALTTADVDLGRIHPDMNIFTAKTASRAWNNDELLLLRHAMYHTAELPVMCKECLSTEKAVFRDEFLKFYEEL